MGLLFRVVVSFVFFSQTVGVKKEESLFMAVKLMKEYWIQKCCTEELILCFVQEIDPDLNYFASAGNASPPRRRETH